MYGIRSYSISLKILKKLSSILARETHCVYEQHTSAQCVRVYAAELSIISDYGLTMNWICTPFRGERILYYLSFARYENRNKRE